MCILDLIGPRCLLLQAVEILLYVSLLCVLCMGCLCMCVYVCVLVGFVMTVTFLFDCFCFWIVKTVQTHTHTHTYINTEELLVGRSFSLALDSALGQIDLPLNQIDVKNVTLGSTDLDIMFDQKLCFFFVCVCVCVCVCVWAYIRCYFFFLNFFLFVKISKK